MRQVTVVGSVVFSAGPRNVDLATFPLKILQVFQDKAGASRISRGVTQREWFGSGREGDLVY